MQGCVRFQVPKYLLCQLSVAKLLAKSHKLQSLIILVDINKFVQYFPRHGKSKVAFNPFHYTQ